MNNWFEEEARSLTMMRDDPKGYEELGRKLEERNSRYYRLKSYLESKALARSSSDSTLKSPSKN